MTRSLALVVRSAAVVGLVWMMVGLDPMPDQRPDRRDGPRPDEPDAALAHRLLDLKDENGFIPPDGLTRAARHVRRMRLERERLRAERGDISVLGAGVEPADWTWLGPGNIGGRLRAILIHPTTPTTMWVGSVSGGIWRTTNGGTSWSPVNDFMANLAVTSLVMHPTNASVLYAGTGEGFGNADSIRGAGVFTSTDGGTTWTQLGSTANSNFYFVNRLAISPSGSVLLAATSTGIHRSTNAGASWTQVTTTRTLDVDFHPTDSARAVAGRADGIAVFSLDGGQSWSTATVPATGGRRVEVAYSRSSPSTVFASVELSSGQIWRSLDGGQSYALRNTGTNYLGSQGWYDDALWVDPTNPDIVIVGGIDLWRSTDAGSSLTRISRWQSAPSSAHADHHAIVQHPGFNGSSNRTVYFGNDGGIYRASDVYTVSQTSGWQELNNNLGVTQFYGAGGNPATGTIVGGTQDNGTLRFRTSTGTEGWTTMFGGDGGWSASDPTDPNYFYGEYVRLQIHRSTNGGASSSYIYSGISDAGSCANFIAPFILDPNDPDTMLAGGCRLWRSLNVKAATVSWSQVKPATADNSPISAVAVAPGNPDLIYVGHNNGDLFRSTNGTAGSPSWTPVGGTLPNRKVTRVTVDPRDWDTVYVTLGGFSPDNVWKSTDGGATWSDATGSGATGLPDVPVRSLVVHPDNSSWLYAGTEVGVFTSEDGGATWSLPQDGPANVSVDELFWMGTTLVAATHGRGLFQATVTGGGGGPTTVFFDDFETNLGWTRNASGADTATTGLWERGDPEATDSSGPKQLGTTVSGTNDLVTARLAGGSAGANDVDGGVTSIQSPAIALPSSGALTLSFSYYLAHATNSSTADFLRVSVVVGSTRTTVFQELGGTEDDDAVWATASLDVTSFAGQTVRLLVEAADASTASLVEAAVDDVRIVRAP
jgi:hypothetical protein